MNYLDLVVINAKNITIKKGCFNECKSLSLFEITESDDITIESKQFDKCTKLTKLKLMSKSNINLFDECICATNNLQTIEIESPNVIIGKSCFENCSNISTFYIKKANEITISNNAFSNCNKLISITFEATKSIIFGNNCFINCFNLKDINFKEYISINRSLRTNYSKFETVKNIIEKLNIGENCFESCKTLSKFKIQNCQKIIINSDSFKGCENLISFSISKCKNIELQKNILSNNIKLKTFEMEGDNIIFNGNIVNNCSSLKKISIISNHPILISKDSFYHCESLINVIFKTQSILEITQENFCFAHAEFIQLEGQQIIIGDNCFTSNLSNNTDFDIVSHEKSPLISIKSNSEVLIGKNCFNGLVIIDSIEINSKAIIIKNNCFNKCESLRIIKLISETTLNILNGSFGQLSNLETIDLSGENIKIDDNCIQKCFIKEKINKSIYSYNHNSVKNTTKFQFNLKNLKLRVNVLMN